MTTHLIALWLMAAQGCLGAFDTLFHHELTEALPRQDSAGRELAIHATRATIYSVLFVGLSFWAWHGVWSIVLFAVFGIEIVLTLWDFVIEDRTRLLPATERVTHTILAINGGAFIALLALNLPDWLAQPSALAWEPYGLLSVFLALCGVGVGISGIRDAFASRVVLRRVAALQAKAPPSFGAAPLHFLVTGATGFIGQKLVIALVRDGHQVTILTRRPRQAAWKFDGGVRCLRNLGDLHPSTRVDVIVNLAGARILGWRWTAKRRADLTQSRVGTTAAVVDWISRAVTKPALLLSASAVGYYGAQPLGDDTPLGEDAPPQPIFMSSLCKEWEAAAAKASDYGTTVATMRFGLVFGRKGALPMMLLPIRFGLGGRLASGRQWMSWIHVDDVIRAIAYLVCTGNASGPYNFTAPEALTQGQFSRVAGKVLKRPSVFPTPGFPLRLMLGEQSDLLLEGQRAEPKRLLQSGFVFEFPAVQGALETLV